MTYRFQCRTTGNVIMRSADGDAVMRIIGRDPAAAGIIETGALPAAIAAIERAIEQEEPRQASTPEPSDPEDVAADADTKVGLRQRTWPLLQMLRSAQASADAVTWGI